MFIELYGPNLTVNTHLHQKKNLLEGHEIMCHFTQGKLFLLP